ncbi:hypothetical protein ACN6KF_005696 [Labrys sp. La1]|uniref:hypothetical protein n=1 Tax=Labrys sp. La1 TaxID=3404917 RepID=UPI003EB98FA3
MMRRLAALFGALPPALGTGPGSELRAPFVTPSAETSPFRDARAFHHTDDLSRLC